MNTIHVTELAIYKRELKENYLIIVQLNTRFQISPPLNVSILWSTILGTYNNQYIFRCYASHQPFSCKIMSLKLPKMKMHKQQVEYWLHLDPIVSRAKEWKGDWELKTDSRENID
jgi:hypothetical protein